MERAAQQRPLVVVLDDLQWADQLSLMLLEFVSRQPRSAPLLVLGAYRHDEPTGDTAARLAGLAAIAEHVHLSGLSAAEVAELVTFATGP